MLYQIKLQKTGKGRIWHISHPWALCHHLGDMVRVSTKKKMVSLEVSKNMRILNNGMCKICQGNFIQRVKRDGLSKLAFLRNKL